MNLIKKEILKAEMQKQKQTVVKPHTRNFIKNLGQKLLNPGRNLLFCLQIKTKFVKTWAGSPSGLILTRGEYYLTDTAW